MIFCSLEGPGRSQCQVDLLGTDQGGVEPGGLGTRGGGTFNKHRLGSQSFSKLVNITENV